MTEPLTATILLPGAAEGDVLRFDRPLSFWGGVDPKSGEIIDPRHPQFGQRLAGRILATERAIGSSSGSSVMLELLAQNLGPAGILLTEPDAILTLGIVVAREMGYGAIPVFLITPEVLDRLPPRLRMSKTGRLEIL